MTGRDLIIYILENHLEDVPIYKDGNIIGLMSDVEAAAKFEVGTATIRVWINAGLLDGVRIGDTIYIPQNASNPKERISNETNNSKPGDDVLHMYNALKQYIDESKPERRDFGFHQTSLY